MGEEGDAFDEEEEAYVYWGWAGIVTEFGCDMVVICLGYLSRYDNS